MCLPSILSHWLREYILCFYFAIVLFTFIYSIFEQNLWMQWIIYLAGAAATFAFQLTRIGPRRVASHRSASRCVAQWHKFQLENVFCVNCKPINDAPPICLEWKRVRGSLLVKTETETVAVEMGLLKSIKSAMVEVENLMH